MTETALILLNFVASVHNEQLWQKNRKSAFQSTISVKVNIYKARYRNKRSTITRDYFESRIRLLQLMKDKHKQ